MNVKEKYREQIASFLGIESKQVHVYWKGRVGLYAILKAMGIGPGDEVVLPAFTCVVVPNAIKYLGAMPIYVDINPKTLCCDVDSVIQALGPKTKAILIQNMLGLSVHVSEIVALAHDKGIYTIEDCTHGFGGKNQGVFNGLKSDVAFFSTQWNKPYSTGIGGMLVVNNLALIDPVQTINNKLIEPSRKDNIELSILLWSRRYLLKGLTYWTLLKLYRILGKRGLITGSSNALEISGTDAPKDYFKGMSTVQCKAGIKALKKMNDTLAFRRNSAMLVHEYLLKNGKATVPNEFLNDHSFLKYPILVAERSAFMNFAESSRIPLGDWFISPLHPVMGSLEAWDLNPNKFPNAVYVSKHIVNLPLDIPNQTLINFLELYKNEII